ERQREEVGIDLRRAEGAVAPTLRRVLEVVGPGDTVRLEQIEDRAGDGLVSAGRREDVIGREMPEGGGGEQVGPVRERLRQHRREVAVVDGELFGEVVIKGNL